MIMQQKRRELTLVLRWPIPQQITVKNPGGDRLKRLWIKAVENKRQR